MRGNRSFRYDLIGSPFLLIAVGCLLADVSMYSSGPFGAGLLQDFTTGCGQPDGSQNSEVQDTIVDG